MLQNSTTDLHIIITIVVSALNLICCRLSRGLDRVGMWATRTGMNGGGDGRPNWSCSAEFVHVCRLWGDLQLPLKHHRIGKR